MTDGTRVWVVANDFQIPFQDDTAVSLFVNFVRDLQPDGVVLNGDVVDAYAVNSYRRNPLFTPRLEEEIEIAGRLMECLAPWTDTRVWLGGNHEDRLRRYLWDRAPELAGLGDLDFPKLFRLADYGFFWLPYGDLYRLGELVVTHGSIVRQHSGATARAHWEKYGQNVLVGHTHRLGAYYHTNLLGPHVAFENGCLCSLTPEYTQWPNWQHGFAVVHVDTDGRFQVQQIPILGASFYYGGRRYGRS